MRVGVFESLTRRRRHGRCGVPCGREHSAGVPLLPDERRPLAYHHFRAFTAVSSSRLRLHRCAQVILLVCVCLATHMAICIDTRGSIADLASLAVTEQIIHDYLVVHFGTPLYLVNKL